MPRKTPGKTPPRPRAPRPSAPRAAATAPPPGEPTVSDAQEMFESHHGVESTDVEGAAGGAPPLTPDAADPGTRGQMLDPLRAQRIHTALTRASRDALARAAFDAIAAPTPRTEGQLAPSLRPYNTLGAAQRQGERTTAANAQRRNRS